MDKRVCQYHATTPTADGWVSPPETSDDTVRAATGRSWNDWCQLIDTTIGPDADHPTIARRLADDHGLDSWWAQCVTVGYERIRGRRLPHQMADGTFTANRSKTISIDRDALRTALLDDDGRTVLFPAFTTELRSKPTSKNVRLAIGNGTAEISMIPAASGRTKIDIGHTRLPAAEDVPIWKEFWGNWLEALDERD